MGLLVWLLGLVVSVVFCRVTGGARSLVWEPGPDGITIGSFGKPLDQPQLVGFGVAVPRGIEFECRRETALDQWFYRIGVGRDTLVGNDVDGIVHLACTTPSLVEALRADPMLRALMRQLVFGVDSGGYRTMGLSCRDGRLEVLFRRAGDGDPTRLQRVVVPRLQALKAALPPPGVDELFRPLSDDGERAAWVVALCHGMLLNGLLQLARLEFSGEPWTLEQEALAVVGVGAAAVLFVALLYTALRTLATSPRLTTVLFAALFAGGMGCLLSGWSLARDVNIAFDFSEPTPLMVQAVTSTGGGRRKVRTTTYTVPGHGRYRIAGRAPGTLLTGDVRRGALGLAWIDLRPVKRHD